MEFADRWVFELEHGNYQESQSSRDRRIDQFARGMGTRITSNPSGLRKLKSCVLFAPGSIWKFPDDAWQIGDEIKSNDSEGAVSDKEILRLQFLYLMVEMLYEERQRFDTFFGFTCGRSEDNAGYIRVEDAKSEMEWLKKKIENISSIQRDARFFLYYNTKKIFCRSKFNRNPNEILAKLKKSSVQNPIPKFEIGT